MAVERSGRDAAKKGYWALVEGGATVWSLQCPDGAVAAHLASSPSPFCYSAGAAPAARDDVKATALPGSAQCELGQAVAGWYNLDNVPANAGQGYVGFQLRCRAVPGLSRVCETKEGFC